MRESFEKDTIKCLVIVLAVTILICLVQCQHACGLQDDIHSLKQQLAHSIQPMSQDTIRDSIPVTVTQVVEVDRTDYKKQEADRQLIKDLELKLSDVTSENRMLRSIMGLVTLKPELDSVLSYHDQWADFRYTVPTQQLEYQVSDSIVTVISRVRKHRFLWIRWGTKGYMVKIVNFNPNARVRYCKYVDIKK